MTRTTAAAALFIPANDNVSSTSGRVRSTRAAYLNSGKVAEYLRLSEADATACGLKAGDRLKAIVLDGGKLLLVRDPSGVTLLENGGLLLARFRKLSTATMAARSVTLRSIPEGIIVAYADQPAPFPFQRLPESFLADFRSLGGDDAGVRRRKFVAANTNGQTAKTTTSAGDECYTPGFFIAIVLRAARRDRFDLDVCSMAKNGRYDIDLAVVTAKWGMTPKPLCQVEAVVRSVPATHFMTAEEEFGSLLFEWTAELIWLNPPYGQRAWAAFLEKAQREVEAGRAGIIVSLVPSDNSGPHSRHLYSEDAYRIELSCQLPFFKLRKYGKEKDEQTGKPKVVAENLIETIRNNQIVVFGKGRKTQEFLLRLLDELLASGYITDGHARHHREVFTCLPRLCAAG